MGSEEDQEVFGGFDEGFKEEVKAGLDMAWVTAMKLTSADKSPINGEKKE